MCNIATMKDKKQIIQIIVSVLVVVFIVVIVIHFKSKGVGNTIPVPVDTTITTELPVKSIKKTSEKPLSYEQAKKLAGGYRLQFNATCSSKPSRLVVPNGKEVLFDNRSDKTLDIIIEGAHLKIKPYSYIMKTFSYKKDLPKTILVDCNGQQNIAKLTIE